MMLFSHLHTFTSCAYLRKRRAKSFKTLHVTHKLIQDNSGIREVAKRMADCKCQDVGQATRLGTDSTKTRLLP